jgi:hypothetical protein
MSQSALQQSGAQPSNRQPKFVPVHISRALAGLVTNRSSLHDPSMWLYSRFYGGAMDALIAGSNIEISPALTWKRRPGLSVLGANTSVYPSAPLTAFSFYNTDGSINLYVDTATGVYLHNNSGAPTLLFTKSAGAGQTAFLQLGDVLYFSNGVDNKKLINSVVYNWASSGPAAAPSVTVNNMSSPRWVFLKTATRTFSS